MKNKRSNYLILALGLLMLFIGVPYLKSEIMGNKINITLSENKQVIGLSAEFPRSKSKPVQDFIREKLNLTDLPDLNSLEIKDYSTPDGEMRFYIKSRPGYVKIQLDKFENDLLAQNRLKATSKELEAVLTK